MRDIWIPLPAGEIKCARGGEVTSDLLSRESKQQVTWNFSPFVLLIPKKTGGNLNCAPNKGEDDRRPGDDGRRRGEYSGLHKKKDFI